MTPTPSPAIVSAPRSVLVTGDVVIDHQIYVGQQRRPGSTMRLGTVESAKDGGAALLADLLIELAKTSPSEAIKGEIHLGVERPTGAASRGKTTKAADAEKAGSPADQQRHRAAHDGPPLSSRGAHPTILLRVIFSAEVGAGDPGFIRIYFTIDCAGPVESHLRS